MLAFFHFLVAVSQCDRINVSCFSIVISLLLRILVGMNRHLSEDAKLKTFAKHAKLINSDFSIWQMKTEAPRVRTTGDVKMAPELHKPDSTNMGKGYIDCHHKEGKKCYLCGMFAACPG